MGKKDDRIFLDLSVIEGLPGLPEDTEPNEHVFQSGTLLDSYMLRGVILSDDGIYVEEFTREIVPLEERPRIKESDYDDPVEEASMFEKIWGSRRKAEQKYEKYEYDGVIHFYTIIDEVIYEYEAEYTDGQLDEIRRISTE